MTKGTLACVVMVLSLACVHGQELTPSALRERGTSTRIERLRRSFASGDSNTDAFWSEIKDSGTPLIEPLGDKHSLVTFLSFLLVDEDVDLAFVKDRREQVTEMRAVASGQNFHSEEGELNA